MKPKFNLLLRQQKGSFVILLMVLPLVFAGCDKRPKPADESAEIQEMQDANVVETISLNASLEGSEEGDPDGSGSASVTIDREAGEVCFDIEVSNIDDPTMAHIHRGAAGESGGVVVNFNTPEQGMSGCVTGVDPDLIEEIIESPGNFYVNVHNAEYSGGAVRGQLVNP